MTNSSPRAEASDLDRRTRRAALVDGIPVVLLGGAALAAGAQPDPASGARTTWVVLSALFTLSLASVLYRAFRRSDEYQRRIQLESMGVTFAVVMVALQLTSLVVATGHGDLRSLVQDITIGGVVLWVVLVDVRTRWGR